MQGKKNVTALSPKIFAASFAPMAAVALFAIFAFSGVTSSIIKSHAVLSARMTTDKMRESIMEALIPSMDKLSNWQSIVSEIHEEKQLSRIMQALSSDLDEDTMFYYATDISRFKKGGFFLNNINWVPPVDWEPNTRSWFKEAIKNEGAFTYNDPYIDSRTNRLCVTFSQAVKGNGGSWLGTAALDVMLDSLLSVIGGMNVSKNTSCYIINSDGMYLTHPDSSKIMKGSYLNDSPLFSHSNKSGYSVGNYLNGKEKAFIQDGRFYSVCSIGSSPWYAVVEGPVSDFNMEFKKKVLIITLILIGISLLCTFIVLRFTISMREKQQKVAEKLFEETQNLVVSTKENAATSQDQSAAVKEIVATMEDNNALSESIAEKIKGVSGVAGKTSGDVMEGVEFLEENVRQLVDIAQANRLTIEGIKDLGGKIRKVWDIVTLITSVADQAKIIAFNAELEASIAGEAGRNFHIVASEIRRLADGILSGTADIKEQINAIQKSSDSLVLSGESGTEKIKSGCERAKRLEERFESIKEASQVTAGSAQDITMIIQQQTAASEQILITLKQIAFGIESFTSSTEGISSSSEKIKSLAEDLNK